MLLADLPKSRQLVFSAEVAAGLKQHPFHHRRIVEGDEEAYGVGQALPESNGNPCTVPGLEGVQSGVRGFVSDNVRAQRPVQDQVLRRKAWRQTFFLSAQGSEVHGTSFAVVVVTRELRRKSTGGDTQLAICSPFDGMA